MTLFRILLPASLVIFILWKSYHSRIFLLGIPFLQVMGNSIFLENLVIFTKPARLPTSVLILEWLCIVWFIATGIVASKNRNNLKLQDLFGPPLVMPEEALLIVLVGVWFLNFFSSLLNTIDFNNVVMTGIDLGCMFLGYLLVRGMISSAPKEDIQKFLFTIILINTIPAILYILNEGLHLPIYQGQQYLTEVFMGTVITRTFWWMPRFYFLSTAYVISRAKWNLVSIAILIITFAGSFFSYSRNTFIIYGCMIAFALIIFAFKRHLLRSISRLVIFIVAGLALFWAISLFFPIELLYLTQRFQIADTSSVIGAVPNLAVRFDFLNRTYALLRNNYLLSGLGMASEATNPMILYLKEWTADITWVAILYRYGVIGIISFSMLFLTSGIRSLKGYFQTDSQAEEELYLMLFLLIFATFAESFVSWTIFDTRNITLSLWFFVFVVITVSRRKDIRIDTLA